MNFILLLITPVIVLLLFNEANKKHKVIGEVTYTESYCGGARPTEEILKQLKSPKPLANKKLYVRKGSVNDITDPIIAEIVSDTSGNFILYLPKGTYSLIMEEKKDKNFYNKIKKKYSEETDIYGEVDKECLNKWLETPDAVFQVKDSINKVTITYNKPCPRNRIPCVNYTGPIPP